MRRRHDALEQRREEQRLAEARVAAASGSPGGEASVGRRAIRRRSPTRRPDSPLRARRAAGATSQVQESLQRRDGRRRRDRRRPAAPPALRELLRAPASRGPCTSTASRRSAIRGRTSTGTSSGCDPSSANQNRNSSTRSNARRYRPGGRGASTDDSSSTLSPGRTASGSAVRWPSHTIALPSGSSQWYASWTPSRPRERHGAVPAFSSRTRARVITPARCSPSS